MFKNIDYKNFNQNPFELIGNEWMLITAKNKQNGKVNAMTASWGGLGFMWGNPVAFVVIRPQRYTIDFVNSSNEFSLCFFDEKYKKTLSYFGTVSGRDEDKISNSGLTVADSSEIPYFNESKIVLLCSNLFKQKFEENCFVDSQIIEKWYQNKDYHYLYIASVNQILQK